MHWYYSKEQTDHKTPSRGDGVDVETEMRYRKEGARFIMELGNKLGLYPFCHLMEQRTTLIYKTK